MLIIYFSICCIGVLIYYIFLKNCIIYYKLFKALYNEVFKRSVRNCHAFIIMFLVNGTNFV